jgi:hypothetical protein
MLGGVAACGGGVSGGSADDKIKSRMQSFVDHLNKGDAKGLINDLAPDQRNGCNEGQIQQALGIFKGVKFELKDVKSKNISGNNGEAEFTVVLAGQASDSPDTQKLIKSGNDWYLDNEGKSCAEFLGE